MDTDHFQKSITTRQELTHDNLQESLTVQILFVRAQVNFQLFQKSGGLFLLEVHDGVKDTVDRIQDEHVESTFKRLAIGISVLGGPLLGLGVEEVVTPELGHHLFLVNTEFLGVTVSELTKSETPTVKTGSKGNSTLFGVDLTVTESFINVGGDDDVDRFNGTRERLKIN
jgi:hypothetical protein